MGCGHNPTCCAHGEGALAPGRATGDRGDKAVRPAGEGQCQRCGRRPRPGGTQGSLTKYLAVQGPAAWLAAISLCDIVACMISPCGCADVQRCGADAQKNAARGAVASSSGPSAQRTGMHGVGCVTRRAAQRYWRSSSKRIASRSVLPQCMALQSHQSNPSPNPVRPSSGSVWARTAAGCGVCARSRWQAPQG